MHNKDHTYLTSVWYCPSFNSFLCFWCLQEDLLDRLGNQCKDWNCWLRGNQQKGRDQHRSYVSKLYSRSQWVDFYYTWQKKFEGGGYLGITLSIHLSICLVNTPLL